MAQSKPGDTINYSMSQDYLPVENSAVNKDFGLEFPGNQYDFEAQHQTASDDGSAQWTSDSGITVFNFPEDWAPETEGSDLDDVFGYGNNNVQHQHSATRRAEQALEQLVAQRVPYIVCNLLYKLSASSHNRITASGAWGHEGTWKFS